MNFFQTVFFILFIQPFDRDPNPWDLVPSTAEFLQCSSRRHGKWGNFDLEAREAPELPSWFN
jgi:hypothetical protein